MPKKTLVLVNPVNPRRRGLALNRSGRFPPLSLGIVAALTSEDWRVSLIDENFDPFAHRDADLVGITAFTASANRAYEIASAYRKRGVPVVMGGLHASMCPEEALGFVNAVVVGEAETAWPRVLADAEAGRLGGTYEGAAASLGGLPRPRRDLFHPGYMFASVQTSRGCPFDCDFCSVTAANGGRYRRRPPEEVLDELQDVPNKLVFFTDDNIIGPDGESRDQAVALFRGMVERRLRKWWFCQASLNFADDSDVLRWAGKAGCKLVAIGLEAADAEALRAVNKRLNVARGVGSYDQALRRIHDAGIAVLGTFILGVDGDTPEKLRRRADYMIGSGVDAVQATRLTPLPGTRLFGRLRDEGRLLRTEFPQDWERYDVTELVHEPFGLDHREASRTISECVRRVYSTRVLLRKASGALWRTRSVVATGFAWQTHKNWRDAALLSAAGP